MEIHTQIRNALNALNIQEARNLVRQALQQTPDAETYYLASLVAISPQQKQDFLQKAATLDPTHEQVLAALKTAEQDTVDSINQLLTLAEQAFAEQRWADV